MVAEVLPGRIRSPLLIPHCDGVLLALLGSCWPFALLDLAVLLAFGFSRQSVRRRRRPRLVGILFSGSLVAAPMFPLAAVCDS